MRQAFVRAMLSAPLIPFILFLGMACGDVVLTQYQQQVIQSIDANSDERNNKVKEGKAMPKQVTPSLEPLPRLSPLLTIV
jgi:hypothetical protein